MSLAKPERSRRRDCALDHPLPTQCPGLSRYPCARGTHGPENAEL